jgi:TRAP-type C4-dicarboxylate transport system permease small subunit
MTAQTDGASAQGAAPAEPTLLDRLTFALAWLAAALFVATGAMLSFEVAARYFFTAPTVWAAELSQLCLVWGCLLAMPWALGAGRHIAVDAVAQQLPWGVRRVVETLAMLVVVAVSGVVTVYGAWIFWDSWERGRTTGSILNLPAWVMELSIPLGFGLLCLQAIVQAGRAWRGDWPGASAHD